MFRTGIRLIVPALACVLTLATSALGRPAPMNFCCICDCVDFAEEADQSGLVPEGGTCVDVSQVVTVNCSAACESVFCLQAGAEQGTCSAVPGCPQATSLMAPSVSAWGLTAIGLALGGIGILTIRRRSAA